MQSKLNKKGHAQESPRQESTHDLFNYDKVNVVAFFVTMLVISIPLFKTGFFFAYDMHYHMLRIESLYQGIIDGQFPVRINPIFLNGFGYGSSLFYPDLFLYIPALFRLMGLSLTTSAKLFVTITNAACYFITYYSAKGISKNKYAAIIAAIVFSLSQYHIQNIFSRFALGEVQSYMFLPLIVYGLYNLIYEEFDKPQLFVIGFSGLMFCHTISVFIAVIVTAVLIIFNIRRIVFHAGKMRSLFLSTCIVLLITCGQWIPFIEQIAADRFMFQNPLFAVSLMAVSPKNLFIPSYYIYNSVCSFDVSIVIMCFMRFFMKKTHINEIDRKKMNWCLYSGFSLLFAASTLFPWKIMPSIFNNIQFPWRLFALASLFLAIAIGIMANILSKNNKEKYTNLLRIMIFSMCLSVPFLFEVDVSPRVCTELDYNNKYNTESIGYAEWLPIDTDYHSFPLFPVAAKDETGMEIQVTKNKTKTTIQYAQNSQYIDFPLLYYKGYTAFFTDVGGNYMDLKVSNQGANKTIRVDCSNITAAGQITVKYTPTFAQNCSFYASILFTLVTLAYYLRKLKVKNPASIVGCY